MSLSFLFITSYPTQPAVCDKLVNTYRHVVRPTNKLFPWQVADGDGSAAVCTAAQGTNGGDGERTPSTTGGVGGVLFSACVYLYTDERRNIPIPSRTRDHAGDVVMTRICFLLTTHAGAHRRAAGSR